MASILSRPQCIKRNAAAKLLVITQSSSFGHILHLFEEVFTPTGCKETTFHGARSGCHVEQSNIIRITCMTPSWTWHAMSSIQIHHIPWCHHQMEPFSALLALCGRIPLVTGAFPSQRPMTWSYNVIFDLLLDKQLSKQSKRRRYETPSRPMPYWQEKHTH